MKGNKEEKTRKGACWGACIILSKTLQVPTLSCALDRDCWKRHLQLQRTNKVTLLSGNIRGFLKHILLVMSGLNMHGGISVSTFRKLRQQVYRTFKNMEPISSRFLDFIIEPVGCAFIM